MFHIDPKARSALIPPPRFSSVMSFVANSVGSVKAHLISIAGKVLGNSFSRPLSTASCGLYVTCPSRFAAS